ncbi:hypothetical protein TWF718_009173 [Orbilia javanica]|uniref:Uncharacterized protein n=1 Tax=Orbilia javanica TaxID=47235 RepID=A0AAN8MLT7_9PEZI
MPGKTSTTVRSSQVAKGTSMTRGAPVDGGSLDVGSNVANPFEDIEAAIGSTSKTPKKPSQHNGPGPILSDILSCMPLQVIQPLRALSAIYGKWIRRVILTRIAFIALTNPSRISGAISGALGLCFANFWLGGNEWLQRFADSVLSVLVVAAAYIKSDPVTFQLLLGDLYEPQDTNVRQLARDSSTPYRSPLSYCLEPYTSPLAFCYDPVVFIPAMLMVYKKLATYFVCPGLEGRVIDGMSILTALFTMWVLFPGFSWNYAVSGRPWTVQDIYDAPTLAQE